MKKFLNILLFMPMTLIGIYYGVLFSVPDDSDTIRAASVFIGIFLVAVPMLILSVFNIILFAFRMKSNDIFIRKLTIILGMITSCAAFLWLLIISSFTVYIVTGIYAFISLVIGIILLISDVENSNQIQ